LNAYNPKPEFVRSYIDQAYATSWVATYQLPVGPGQKYFNNKGITGQLIGGWQISGILTYSGGSPMGATNSYNPLLVNSFDRPNIDPSVPLKTYNYAKSKAYFTGKASTPPVQFPTNAFVNTGPWAVGDSVRAYPAFHIAEGVVASLRVDYFNAFNRTRLQQPDMNSLDSTFGQIINLSSQISNRQGQATFRVEF
jgi:hypothetical protein